MTKQTLFFGLFMLLISMIVGCAKDDDGGGGGNTPLYDPTVLIDTYEREVRKGCAGDIVSDEFVRRPAINSLKVNPDENIYIAAASFFNLENGLEFTPSGVIFPGPGGDNLKRVTFCQEPRVGGCGLAVKSGDNRIEYKYWTQENPDIMGEHRVKTIRFTTSAETSSKTCFREPSSCPVSSSTTWGECIY